MPLKIQNYAEWEENERKGHHPPACTCYRCNELRMEQEAAEEERHRAAEYDRRIALVNNRGRKRDRSPLLAAGPKRTVFPWLLLVAATGGMAIGVVYAVNSGLLG